MVPVVPPEGMFCKTQRRQILKHRGHNLGLRGNERNDNATGSNQVAVKLSALLSVKRGYRKAMTINSLHTRWTRLSLRSHTHRYLVKGGRSGGEEGVARLHDSVR